jgi:hypothetical protein
MEIWLEAAFSHDGGGGFVEQMLIFAAALGVNKFIVNTIMIRSNFVDF